MYHICILEYLILREQAWPYKPNFLSVDESEDRDYSNVNYLQIGFLNFKAKSKNKIGGPFMPKLAIKPYLEVSPPVASVTKPQIYGEGK